jgi:uncharacterized protein YutE (UPF0331/DUF86 family)
MVDKTLILRKLAKLDEYKAQIREYASITQEEYEENWKVQRIVDRTLQIMIETCLDVAGHIISDEGFRVPETYSDMFKILIENQVLNQEHSNPLNKMAKFRNIVVHNYEKMDPSIVVGILRDNLEDFENFKNAIIAYLKTKEATNP